MTILGKLARNGRPLGSICNVFQGIVTGANKVSPKHILNFDIEAKIGDGIFVLSEQEVRQLKLTQKELQFIKPWYKNSDIKRFYCVGAKKESLIYRSSKHIEDELPNIKKHLTRFKKILINRNIRAGQITPKEYDDFVQGKGQIDYVMIASAMKAGNFYCISYARDEEVFDGPKIICSQRTYGNTFGYNEIQWYAGSDVCFIASKDQSISLKYVLALLNSKLYYVWLYYKGKRKGEMLELCPKPVSEIPIKCITSFDQRPFITLVDQILMAKASNPATVTSALEQKIDTLVYALYNLTSVEIALIEAAH